ncbi:MFS transporter [Kordiimonas pumila]|uniref:MFS transporter n=1 Tax=Kordiimonas pumila TaxID=2161677 RepID=A0ABV7D2I3_9PROT|nr:MFS transporter [Kordiimonas pumila]
MPILVLIVFSVMAAFALLLPTIMFFLQNLGASTAQATQILACYSLAQFMAGPFLGRLSDRLGRKPVMMVALITSCLSYYCLANYSNGLVGVAVTIACAGFCAGVVPVIFAAATDITTVEKRSASLGALGAGIGTAFTLGPAFGAFLGNSEAGQASITLPASFSCLMVLVGFGAACFWRTKTDANLAQTKEHTAGHSSIAQLAVLRYIKSKPILMVICLMMFFFTLALALMEPVMPYFTHDRFSWGPKDLGYLFAYAGLVVIIVQGGLVGRLAKKYGELNLTRYGALSMAVGLIVMVYSPSPVWVFLAVTMTGTGSALFNTSILTTGSKVATPNERGLILGAIQSMQALGRSTGPLIAGALYVHAQHIPMLAGVGLMVFVGALSVLLFGFVRKELIQR